LGATTPSRFDPSEFVKPLKPGTEYVEHDRYRLYWIRDDEVICGPDSVVKGADAESFVFYLGSFAKDKRHCYFMGNRLAGANPSAFHALNNTYFKDDSFVWCIGGRIKDADAGSFVACDDGIYVIGSTPFPHGYGKDRERVFYYDFDGKACWVRKADPTSFESLNDGYFGRDARFVFCGHASIARADVRTWRKLGAIYSADSKRVFYLNREMGGADCETFRVIPSKDGRTLFARDRSHFYHYERVIDYDRDGAQRWREFALPDVEGDLPPACDTKVTFLPTAAAPTKRPPKCNCAELPDVRQAPASKFPEKRYERVADKAHPMELFGKSRCAIILFRCRSCGQHWQADQWSRNHGYTAWPELSIKIATPRDWPKFNDYQLRLGYFPPMENGVVPEDNVWKRCATPGCKDPAVRGLNHCANCACRAMHLQRGG
jgi:hypothetical protein